MDISKITNNIVNNTISETKNKVIDDSFEQLLQSALGKDDEMELKKACRDFEAIMLNMMYKGMKNTIPKSDLIPSDTGKDIFDSMLDDQLVEEASKGQGVGLADILYKQLSKQLGSTYKTINGGETGIDKKK